MLAGELKPVVTLPILRWGAVIDWRVTTVHDTSSHRTRLASQLEGFY